MTTDIRSRKGARKQKHSERLAILAPGLLLLVLIAGCVSPSPQPPPTPPPTTPAVAACTTKECFISSANACNEIDLTLTEDAGVIKYSSSKDCVFTKTLVTANADETQEMKSLLQGKSLTCRYEKGKFDPRWVTSLIYGTEYCEGELRDTLAELIAFL
ncbi:MAG: hypothetical protein HY555_03390 [Euryarchaeota archaeon]|nr:hypothetical protein [Euryarchaeota archaeon]